MPVLQKLQKGSALSGANFPDFVEAWNWLVDFVSNLKGDADLSPKTGSIKIDKSNPNNPVIRFHNSNSNDGTISVTGTDGETVVGSSIEFVSSEDSNVTVIAELKKKESTGDGEEELTDTIVCKVGVYYI